MTMLVTGRDCWLTLSYQQFPQGNRGTGQWHGAGAH